MCGINGFSFKNEQIISEMNELLAHRGPDSFGVYSSESVSLGHRRLKIIDLSEKGSQPMFDDKKEIVLVFNGEIYNFKDLKDILEKEGYKFRSHSDSEVIINGYKRWGPECVKYFNGMWAFAIYDLKKQKLFLSKDRLGKKPLFYSLLNDNLIFSSEIKPLFRHDIKKEINPKAVSSFLSYRYVLGGETMFKNILKLLPGNNLLFDLKSKKIEKIWSYWDLIDSDQDISESNAKKQVEDLLKDAISLRQISDVPIGSINSGGLDSSLISAIMAKINSDKIRTFTVKFPEEGFDETPFAKLLAEHCKTLHKEITIDTSNFLKLMGDYSKLKDEPIGVPNEIALYLLFKKIKEDVTVVLSGEGADEAFAGYGRIFRSPYDYERIKDIQRQGKDKYKEKYPSLYKKYNGNFFDTELDHFLFLYNYFPEKNLLLKKDFNIDLRSFFKNCFDKIHSSYEKKITYVFLKLHLPGLLARLDNSSMANAVEARCPFLDYRLIEKAFNLPFDLKNHWKSEQDRKEAEFKNSDEISEENDTPKYILKKIASSYIPKEIIDRKKQGFPLPLQKWFRTDFFNECKRSLLSKDSKIIMVANQKAIEKWMDEGTNSEDKNFGQKLWMLLSLEMWLREWF